MINNNFNRRNIDTSQIFDEKYKVNQRREINEKNRQRETSFKNRLYDVDNMQILKEKNIKENTVTSKVEALNQKINANNAMYKNSAMNNLKDRFK